MIIEYIIISHISLILLSTNKLTDYIKYTMIYINIYIYIFINNINTIQILFNKLTNEKI